MNGLGRAAQMLRFAVAGALGFVVDAGVLAALLGVGSGFWLGRLASFVAAAYTTWQINRRWTFAVAGTPAPGTFARYLGAMTLGAALNWVVYASVVLALARNDQWSPAAVAVAAVAAGSTAGLLLNFATARAWVFAARRR